MSCVALSQDVVRTLVRAARRHERTPRIQDTLETQRLRFSAFFCGVARRHADRSIEKVSLEWLLVVSYDIPTFFRNAD